MLLLTLNARDKVRKPLAAYIQDAKGRATSGRMREMLDWYQGLGHGQKEFRLKAVVPLFIKRFAEHYSFDCWCYPPLVYRGTGTARVVHFVFDLTATQALMHASSRQAEEDVLDLTFLSRSRCSVLTQHSTTGGTRGRQQTNSPSCHQM